MAARHARVGAADPGECQLVQALREADMNEAVMKLVDEWAKMIGRSFDSLSPANRTTAYRLLALRLQSKIPPREWFMRELAAHFPAGTPAAALAEGVEAACRYFAESEDMYRAFAVGKTVTEAAANRLFLEARPAAAAPPAASGTWHDRPPLL